MNRHVTALVFFLVASVAALLYVSIRDGQRIGALADALHVAQESYSGAFASFEKMRDLQQRDAKTYAEREAASLAEAQASYEVEFERQQRQRQRRSR